MTQLDTDTARLVAHLADLQARVNDLNTEAESVKAELRRLNPGDYSLNGKTVLRIIPTRRFDPTKALELVPEPLRPECYTTAPDATKIRQYLAPALQEQCMVVAGKPKVVLA